MHRNIFGANIALQPLLEDVTQSAQPFVVRGENRDSFDASGPIRKLGIRPAGEGQDGGARQSDFTCW
jgi:hypothetical protein